jgi:hypothetical protein
MTNLAPRAACALLAFLATAPAFAAPATPLGSFGQWNAAAYGAGPDRRCYILATPATAEPSTLRHGDVHFFVQTGDGAQRTESSLQAGYDFASGSEITLTIGDETFRMVTQGSNAWLRRLEREPELLAAMRAGREMEVEARSVRGNQTSYTFSLDGVTAASKLLASCD